MDWEKYSWVMKSKQRQEILPLLEKPRTPTEIADEIGAHIAQVSASLSEFEEQGIVEVMNEEARKGRLYRLTSEGEEILEELRSE